MNVTIKDVAKYAGVTAAIVSRVLNNDSTLSIKQETRDKVYEAVQTLSYQPNPYARGLRSKVTQTLGMLVPDIANPFFSDIIKGAQDAAMLNNIYIIIMNTDEIWENEKKMIEILVNKRVDGILYLSAHLDIKATQLMKKHEIPYVLVNRNSVDSETSFVGLDNVGGAILAMQHLVSLNHKKIAHITGPLYTDTGSGRLQGYHKGLVMADIEYDPDYVVESIFSFEGGFKAIQRLLALKTPPTAVFAANDLIAMGAIVGAVDMGYSVPEDISIIGFNNIWIANYFNPQLTTISFDNYEMGYEACKILIDNIEKTKVETSQLILEPTLVIRKSTSQPGI